MYLEENAFIFFRLKETPKVMAGAEAIISEAIIMCVAWKEKLEFGESRIFIGRHFALLTL